MEPKRDIKRNIYCDICNVRFTTFELLLEHFEEAEHKKLLASYPENGVKLRGLKPGYDAARLISLMNCHGTTIFTSCPPHWRHASFVFQDAHAAKSLIAARKFDFCGQSVKVKPLKMQIPCAPQLNESGSVSNEILSLHTQAPLPGGSQATLSTPSQLRRTKRLLRAKHFRGEQAKQLNSEQVTTDHTQPVRKRKNFANKYEKGSPWQVNDPRKCVLVVGFKSRNDLPDLENTMSTFGKIAESRFSARGKTVIFQYEDSSSAAAALNFGRLEFAGRKLVVRRMNASIHQFVENSFQRAAVAAVNLIKTSHSTDEQLAELEQRVTDCVEVREYRVAAMLSDISDAICKLYPGMVMHPFGSSATGLAFFDSDVDLFIELPFPDKHCVSHVTDQLRRFGHPFCEVVPVLGAKTPLVKFKHALTGLSCDVSFRNCLGVRNSRLLQHYMGMHSRVRQMMMTVKLWARIQGVASSHGGATSYALGLMVIFFLQKCGLVPPIADLLQSEDHAETVDGWKCGFRPSSDKICIEEPLAKLLKSFFNFYRNFEWERFVVCPLLGIEVDRDDLLDADKLPPEMGPLKAKLATKESMGFQSESSRAMCVQDPFVLDHNLTRGIILTKANDFFNLIIATDVAIAMESDSLVLPLLLSMQNAKVAQGMSSCLCRIQIPRPPIDEAEWITRLWHHLAKVLTSVLKLRVTKVVCGKHSETAELNCFGFDDIITGRSKAENMLFVEDRDGFKKLSPIAKQVAITDRLLGASVGKKNTKAQGEDSSEGKISDSERMSPSTVEDFDEDKVPDSGDMQLENSFSILEDATDFDSDSGDGIDEVKTNLATQAVTVPEKMEIVNEVFSFMKGIDFAWHSEQVEPVNSKPITQFVVRASRRKHHILINFQNNGPFDKYVRKLSACIQHKLPAWIIAELKQGY